MNGSMPTGQLGFRGWLADVLPHYQGSELEAGGLHLPPEGPRALLLFD
jgi:hypothetical protein